MGQNDLRPANASGAEAASNEADSAEQTVDPAGEFEIVTRQAATGIVGDHSDTDLFVADVQIRVMI